MPLQLIGLVPPAGKSSIYPLQKLRNVHTFSGGLSHGVPHCCQQWGRHKVDWEPRLSSEHQIVGTVPSNCRWGGIVGMCYFSQMRWSVSFFVFSQLPNHVHNYLVQSLPVPSSGVVGHGPQSFDAKDHAQFLNYTTGEASASIT